MYTSPGPTGFHWMFRLPVSVGDDSGPPRPAGGSSPIRSPSRSGVRVSVAMVFPERSHTSCTEPKLDTGTRYENGSSIFVTRTYWPSGDRSTDRNIAGGPTFRMLLLFTSISASWPVV